MRPSQFLLRARVVAPISHPPIPNGAVLITGDRIADVGRWRDLSQRSRGQVFDLGDVALLPGLVNAHCHLDYTGMAGQFPPPKLFTDWIKLITSTKAQWSYSEFAQSWLEGAQMLARTGTTTVGDIENVFELLPDVWEATSLRVFSFLEMTGVKSRRQPSAILREATDTVESLRSRRCWTGLSPHAPYSTQPELLRLTAELARRRGWRVCTHVAESALEFEMFAKGRGEMFNWLQRSGRDMSDCGLGSPVMHLERHGALNQNLLAVHVNYLSRGDAATLGRHKVSVVHCPRSHAYFGHDPFPRRKLERAGVNVCLGTDSLASVLRARRQILQLNMFEEMGALAKNDPGLRAKTILRWATINGARALGLQGQVGEFAPGAFADLIAVPFAGKTSAMHESLVSHEGDVAASMIGGQWVKRDA